MARCGFVRPDTTKLPLSEGDWVEVKKYLNSGEDKRLTLGDGVQATGDSEYTVDLAGRMFLPLEVYLVAWSFTDFDGNQTKPTPENIRALDPAIEAEIRAALEKHIEAMGAARSRPQPAPAGATN